MTAPYRDGPDVSWTPGLETEQDGLVPADVPFHLGRGDTGPVQQSSVTCGSASLTLARMLASPEFGQWIVNGVDPRGGPPDSRSENERFAEHEREVMNRTNGIRAAGGKLNLPWPHAMGTPPWGAAKELEYGAARPGAAYAMRVVRLGSGDALRNAHRDLVGVVGDGLPALLYIGNGWAPRHVTLVLPAEGSGQLDVYDPATGSVTELAVDRFASRTLEIAGWNVPWITVQPRPS